LSHSDAVYREDVRLPSAIWLSSAALILSLAFLVFIFFDPFGWQPGSDPGAGVLWVPVVAFIALAWFTLSVGKFSIIVTPERLSVAAGMNANSVTWADIDSASEDLSRRAPCNPLTAMPSVLDGEKTMVYAIGCLPRIEISTNNERLRRLIFPTRNPDALLEIIRERTRTARRAAAWGGVQQGIISDNAIDDRGRPDGVGGPPPFFFPT
jgi:hypothetical protein